MSVLTHSAKDRVLIFSRKLSPFGLNRQTFVKKFWTGLSSYKCSLSAISLVCPTCIDLCMTSPVLELHGHYECQKEEFAFTRAVSGKLTSRKKTYFRHRIEEQINRESITISTSVAFVEDFRG